MHSCKQVISVAPPFIFTSNGLLPVYTNDPCKVALFNITAPLLSIAIAKLEAIILTESPSTLFPLVDLITGPEPKFVTLTLVSKTTVEPPLIFYN